MLVVWNTFSSPDFKLDLDPGYYAAPLTRPSLGPIITFTRASTPTLIQPLALPHPGRDKEVVYPAMHWCLQRLPQLKKRAYLARYLMPVEVPMEFMQDQALIDLHESYRQLQASAPAVRIHTPRSRVKNVAACVCRVGAKAGGGRRESVFGNRTYGEVQVQDMNARKKRESGM